MTKTSKKPKRTYIRLEPAAIYNKAIIREAKNGCITYSYTRLVECAAEDLGEKNDDLEEAVEWVEYNILGLQNDSQFFRVAYD